MSARKLLLATSAGVLLGISGVAGAGFFHRVSADEMAHIERQNQRQQWIEDHPYGEREVVLVPVPQPYYAVPPGAYPGYAQPPSVSLIQVTSAVYGAGSQCDATHALRYACDGKRSCVVDVSNGMCGDPAPGKRKGVTVEYLCGGSEIKYGSAPEGRGLYLDCD